MYKLYVGLGYSCTGSVYIFIAIATLIGTPTAGALLKVVDEKHFNALIIFTGVLLAAGTVALVGAAAVGSEQVDKVRTKFSRSRTSAPEGIL